MKVANWALQALHAAYLIIVYTKMDNWWMDTLRTH